MNVVRAKKSYGQHFLKSSDTAKRIAECSKGHSCNNFLEIGPGMGILTKPLQEIHKHLKVVELDVESIDYLMAHNVIPAENCIQGDFLRLPIPDLFNNEEFCVVGNFPYNISSQIVFKILEYKELIPGMTGMFQKEVARRICSPKGSKEYGILSVLTQAFYNTEYHFTLDEHEFNPPPKVKSGVISLYRKKDLQLPCNEKLFKEVVKTSFNQRRKTLNNSLKSLLHDNKLEEKIGGLRPEQLDYTDFINLTNYIEPFQNYKKG